MEVFTAQIIYRIKSGSSNTEQYEEQWRLVYAEDEYEALEAAREIGKEEEATFVDRHGRTVCWELVAVKDLQQVHLKQGAILFSTVKEIEPIAAPLWTV